MKFHKCHRVMRQLMFAIYNKIKWVLMAQEFRISDEMLDFAQRLDVENHNVKSYRKRQTSKKNQHRSNHKKCQNSVELFGFTFCEEGRVDKSVEKTARTTEVLSTKRFSTTAGVKKRSQLDVNSPAFNLTGRTKLSSAIENTSDVGQTQRQKVTSAFGLSENREPLGKFSKKEKEMCRKGQLQNKHFEEWLNQTLLEYCTNEKFDMTIQNSALKKYGIDKNSLLSKGINPQNLDRIFRSLFVYSMGFNSLLKELGGKQIRKSLWKVYAILLQYCSDGEFETMIGEIERDKVAKMDSLRSQIQKRQQVIQNNEQINHQKNIKIFKELKHLRDANNDLTNDKTMLMQDFKQAEQAFNEEVSLRLKFENKINEIHGVHRQLGIKHQKLYDDLQIKVNETTSIKQKYEKITEKYIESKHNLQAVQNSLEKLEEENKYCIQHNALLKEKVFGFQLKEIQWNKRQIELRCLIHEKEKKVDQIKKEIVNAELIIQMKQDTEKELQKEYRRSLEENKQLVGSLQSQLQELSKYMQEKKEFNDTHSRLYAELAVVTASLLEKKENIEKNRQIIKDLHLTLHEKDGEVQAAERKYEQLSMSLTDCYNKIQQMKRIKSDYEQELNDLKGKEEAHQLYFNEKEKQITDLSDKLEAAERRISEFYITKKTLESKVALLTQKIASDEEMSKRKIERLEEQFKIVDKQRRQLLIEVQTKRTEASKHAQLYEQILVKLKDNIFQRNDVQLRYSQSLVVVQSQTGHIKHLNIKISEIQERNEELSRKMKGMEFMMEGKEKTFKMEVGVLNETINKLKGQLKFRKNFIHPMRFEDLLSNITILDSKIIELKNQIKRKTAESQERILNVKLERLTADLETNQEAYKEMLAKKDTSIEAQRQKVIQLESKLKQLTEQNQQIKSDHSFREKQKKYLSFISEKNAKIEQLLKELQKLQDSHTRMVKSLDEAQIELQSKQSKIIEYESKQTHLEAEKQIIKQERLHLEKQKKTLQSKLSQKQFQMGKTIEKLNEGEESINPSSRDTKSRQKSRLNSKQEKSREKLQQRVEWRNDFSKKIKNATTYYKK